MAAPRAFYRPDHNHGLKGAVEITHAVGAQPLPEGYKPPTPVHDPDVSPADTSKGVVFGSDGERADYLRGMYRGAACFLVCGGPSVQFSPLRLLERRGVLIAAVNNAGAAVVRPHVWFSCDAQHQFHEAIWRDPQIMKLTKLKYTSEKHKWAGSRRSRPVIHRWNGKEYVETNDRPADCPNVWGYMHADFKHQKWNPAKYFDEPLPPWGANHREHDPEDKGDFKSVMLVAPWLLRWLGVKTIYLVGCDFRMTKERQYGFDEAGKPDRNNGLYGWLNRRFTEVAPHMPAAGIEIFNCTVGGHLTAFPRMTLEDAIRRALAEFPAEIHTRGHYRT